MVVAQSAMTVAAVTKSKRDGVSCQEGRRILQMNISPAFILSKKFKFLEDNLPNTQV